MKRFFLIIPFVAQSLFASDPSTADVHFTKGFEGKVKYERMQHSDHLKMEAAVNGRLENDVFWADSKLKFSISDVSSKKKHTDIDMERLLFGYTVLDQSPYSAFLEIGREKLDSLFDSKVQYVSYFNGFHESFSLGNLTIHSAQSVIDSSESTYSLILEAIYQDLFDVPLTVSYGITDWLMEEDFLISQITAKYKIGDVLKKKTSLYGALLSNHKGKCHQDHQGFYCGICWGEVKKANDWLLDVNYQYTGEECVPDFDYNGIGNGVQIKGAVGVTTNLSLQTKVNLANKCKLEVAAICKW